MKRASRSKRLDRVRRSPSIYSRTEAIKEKKNRSYFLLYFMLISFIGLVTYLILFSPYLKVSKVNITSLKYYDITKVESLVNSHQSNILNKNIITYSSKTLEKKIGETGGVKSVRVVKKYTKKEIDVVIEEQRPVFIWETVGKKYLVDENGILTAEYEDKFKDIPVVIDSKNLPVTLKDQISTATFSKFIDELSFDFQTYTSTKIVKIEVPEITSEIKVSTEAGWYALFDTTRTAKGQLVNLSRIISEVKAKNKKLEYVDLRIDNRIFYK